MKSLPLMLVLGVALLAANPHRATADTAYKDAELSVEVFECMRYDKVVTCKLRIKFIEVFNDITLKTDSMFAISKNGLRIRVRNVKFTRPNEWVKNQFPARFFTDPQWPEYTIHPDLGDEEIFELVFDRSELSDVPYQIEIYIKGNRSLLKIRSILLTPFFDKEITLGTPPADERSRDN